MGSLRSLIKFIPLSYGKETITAKKKKDEKKGKKKGEGKK